MVLVGDHIHVLFQKRALIHLVLSLITVLIIFIPQLSCLTTNGYGWFLLISSESFNFLLLIRFRHLNNFTISERMHINILSHTLNSFKDFQCNRLKSSSVKTEAANLSIIVGTPLMSPSMCFNSSKKTQCSWQGDLAVHLLLLRRYFCASRKK